MGNCGRSKDFPPINDKIMKLVRQGYKNKTMMAPEYRHRCIVWGVQPQYCIDQLYWMVNCWGVVPLTDMLSMVVEKEFCEENKPKVAVLCVPRDGAQQVSGRLVDLGIEGFWNFSHYDLSVSYPNVVVENVHLGDSLMSLGYRLRNQE